MYVDILCSYYSSFVYNVQFERLGLEHRLRFLRAYVFTKVMVFLSAIAKEWWEF